VNRTVLITEREVVAPFGERERVDGALNEIHITRVEVRPFLHAVMCVGGGLSEVATSQGLGDAPVELSEGAPERARRSPFGRVHGQPPWGAAGPPSFAPALWEAASDARCVVCVWILARGLCTAGAFAIVGTPR
jgi:hypothetical protein